MVQLSVRPEKIAIDDDIDERMVSLPGTVESRVYLGVSTQITVSFGDGARMVALEQATYRARADDRWEEGTEVRLGWHPENCLVLR
jgi:ABC-type Fe3+/spermidine/putrescine transport system ATPase subunit